MRRRHSAGFTLLELVIATVLLGMLAVAGLNMVGDTMQTAYTTSLNQSSGSTARYAAERITREVREMGFGATGYNISAWNSTSLTFTKEDDTIVTIAFSGSTLTMTYNPGTSATLSDQVSAFALTYHDQFGGVTTEKEDVRFVQVALTLTNSKTGQADSFRTRIFLRNSQMSAT